MENLDNDISSIENTEVYQDRSRKLKKGELFDPDLRVRLAQNKSLAALKALKEKIESFRSRHSKALGSVSVASGVSIQKSRAQGCSDLTQLDWAFIGMLPGRMGNNSVSLLVSIYVIVTNITTHIDKRLRNPEIRVA